jgi:predicted HicB family RNase H-like nuclease
VDDARRGGYRGSVVCDVEAKIFHGEVLGLRDVVTFQAMTVVDIQHAFRESVEDYLVFCEE